ncbi:MAG: 3-demethylubiquinone-9 3-methyltransferase [Verrucomicrobia bacterium]|jgi:predicted 3-demethylubiquinone-9 3-methyltransferase (glyoxalase superfamily)|nr:3-demethylubiquinone-9 3-methyltransferase [Verrucomicrobiota bacterium]
MKANKPKITATGISQKLTPCLWFDNNAEEAVKFYCSVFKKTKVLQVAYYGESGMGKKGSVMTIRFQLEGQEFLALNGGPHFKFTPAVSFMIDCKTQKEVDSYWAKLSKDGHIQQCGWVADKFGLCWQVVPRRLMELIQSKDEAKADRVMAAMLKMIKLDVAGLEKAAAAEPATYAKAKKK